MAARKGSTGTSRGSSGNSKTKKSTATRKTSGTAKKTSAGAGKKTQAKSSTKSGAKRGAGSPVGNNAANAGADSAVRSEISILVALALTLFGTLSVFGLCGSAGAVVRNFLFGVFGILAYPVPLLFFLAVMFFVSNLGNGKALGKLVAALLMVPDLCGLIQLIVSPYVKGETLKEIYEARTGGGWLGGAVKQGLCSIFDVVGAYLILVLILLICLVVITEKSLTRWLRARGEQILGHARDDYDYRVEQNEENRVRSEERKEEQRIQREERRRKAEERRMQEEELREERKRRTDHKSWGVEIREGTVFGDAEAEEGGQPAAKTARERKKGSAWRTEDTFFDEEEYGDSSVTSAEGRDRRRYADPEGRRKANSGEEDLEGRRRVDPWQTGTEGRRKADPREEDPEDRKKTDPWGSDTESRVKADAEESGAEGRRTRKSERKFAGFSGSEGETEKPAVEWWNPQETADPVSGDVIDQLERELKHAYEDEPENPGEEARSGRTEEDADPDDLSEGVRRLDFMQERVNRRMEEFETAKPGRNKNAETQTEQDPGSEVETETQQDPWGETETGTEQGSWSKAETGTEQKPWNEAGTDTGASGGKSGAGTGTSYNGRKGYDAGTNGETTTGGGKAGYGSGATGAGKNGIGMSGGEKPAPPPRPPYRKPPTSLLSAGGRTERDSQAELNRVADKLQDTLKRFGVNVTITDVSRGPSVTRYELLPEAGTRVNRITSLADDIKLALAATDIRIEAPIPGKSAIGIEVPNKRRETVYLKELVESGELKGHTSKIAFAAGKDIAGKVVVADIAKMPHMLIAGTTGSGKSVFTNSIIMTILFRATPDEVKLIIIDPKVVEFGIYNGIPHLMTPVVTDPRKAAEALKWATAEMSRRYQAFANENVRDLKGYNRKIEREHLTDKDGVPLQKLPQIVIIIDELADLMMVAAKDVEETICRLAQLARAAGIHLIIATQRPSVDVVTGLIKANIPSRVALLVSSGVDSRTIIDMNGAEKLLGNGDMLFAPSGYAKPVRLQGAFVSDEEVRSVVDFLKQQVPEGAAYDDSMFQEAESVNAEEADESNNEQDELFADAGRFLIEKKRASVSLLQRKFRVGFNRAARIIDQLEEAGVVGEELGTKPRNVLMTQEEFEELLKSR